MSDPTITTIGVKVYGIDAADRYAYRTLRESGFSRTDANVITTLAVVSGAAGPDAHVEVRVDGEPIPDGPGAYAFAIVAALDYVANHPDLYDKVDGLL